MRSIACRSAGSRTRPLTRRRVVRVHAAPLHEPMSNRAVGRSVREAGREYRCRRARLLSPMPKRAETLVFWTPLVGGLVAAAILAPALKPLGVVVLLFPPVLAAIALGAGPLLRWLVRLVLAAQVFLGVFV